MNLAPSTNSRTSSDAADQHQFTELERMVRSEAPYLSKGVFDPKAIEAMATAFRRVCASLALADQDDPVTRTVARQVIEIAGTGEREPGRIADLVLLALKDPHASSQ
jgi:hypothetical protein